MLLSGTPRGSVGFEVGGVDQCQWWRHTHATHTHRASDAYTCRKHAFMSGIEMQTDNRRTVIYRQRARSGHAEQWKAGILIVTFENLVCSDYREGQRWTRAFCQVRGDAPSLLSWDWCNCSNICVCVHLTICKVDVETKGVTSDISDFLFDFLQSRLC